MASYFYLLCIDLPPTDFCFVLSLVNSLFVFVNRNLDERKNVTLAARGSDSSADFWRKKISYLQVIKYFLVT